MKMQLSKKYIAFLFMLALVCRVFSQIEWNPSLTQTQKTAILKQLELQQAEIRGKRPIYGVISVKGQVCWVGVRGGHTNLIGFRPLPSQAFDARLFEKDGKEISKTFFYGHKFGQMLKPDKEFKEFLNGKGPGAIHEMYDGTRRTLVFAAGAGNDHYWDFDILKSFRIKEAGEYRLQVQVRLFVKDTNSVFQPFVLPPVETKVNISESDL